MSEPTMHVEQATAVLREEAGDAIAVLTMSPMAFWGEPRPLDFRLLGTMGAAASIGLGIALGTADRPVWVIDGDGSLLMQLGVLAAVADAAPDNFVHVLVDNGIYAISGAQPTPAPRDWAALFSAAGYRDAVECETPDEVRAALRRDAPGPRALVLRCLRERPAYAPGALQAEPAHEAAQIRDGLAGARV